MAYPQNKLILFLILNLVFFSCETNPNSTINTLNQEEIKTKVHQKTVANSDSIVIEKSTPNRDSLIKKIDYYYSGNIKEWYSIDKNGLRQGVAKSFDSLTGYLTTTINYIDGKKIGDKYTYKEGKRYQYYLLLNDSTYERMRKYHDEIFFYEFRKGDEITYLGNHLQDTIIYSTDYSGLKYIPKSKKHSNGKQNKK